MTPWTDTDANSVYGNSRVRIAIYAPTTELMGTTASSAEIFYKPSTTSTYYEFVGNGPGDRVLAYTHPDFPDYILFDCANPQYPGAHFGQEGGFLEENEYDYKVKLYVDNCSTTANQVIISGAVPNFNP